jgi:hypothetical protein
MPKEYIVRLVFDRRHRSLALCKGQHVRPPAHAMTWDLGGEGGVIQTDVSSFFLPSKSFLSGGRDRMSRR